MKKRVKHLLASACTALFLSTMTAFSVYAEVPQGPAYTDAEASDGTSSVGEAFEEAHTPDDSPEPGPGYDDAVAEASVREGLQAGSQDGPGHKRSKQTKSAKDGDAPEQEPLTGIPQAAQKYSSEEIAAMTGDSLGTFVVSGYCGCSECSSGFNLTYSGTVPKPEHTIAADITLYPIGTQLIIDGIVYTVEDTGSMVDGNRLDVFFDSHEDALAFGLQNLEVFSVRQP